MARLTTNHIDEKIRLDDGQIGQIGLNNGQIDKMDVHIDQKYGQIDQIDDHIGPKNGHNDQLDGWKGLNGLQKVLRLTFDFRNHS